MKILVPIDDDELSTTALPEAERLAAEDGPGELVLVMVGELAEVSAHAAEERKELEERLSEVAGRVSDIPVHTRVALAGDPVRGVLEIAREEHIDRIVMATHPRGPIRALLDDSVADALRSLGEFPMTIVRPDGPVVSD